MQKDKVSIVIDQGNTLTKVGVFNSEKIIKTFIFPIFTGSEWSQICKGYKISKVLFASVKESMPDFLISKDYFLHELTHQSNLPFKSNYKTMSTLGVDRIGNVAAIFSYQLFPALIIDIGSCITYDYVDSEKIFQGGAISPGINMRFKAMHEYTGKLPLVAFQEDLTFKIGTTTSESMISGVTEGIKGEINRYIEKFSPKTGELTIFLTGGDARFFDLEAKNHIFANSHLTLLGFNEILKLNAQA